MSIQVRDKSTKIQFQIELPILSNFNKIYVLIELFWTRILKSNLYYFVISPSLLWYGQVDNGQFI